MLSHRKVARMSCITVVAAEASGSWKEGGKKSHGPDPRQVVSENPRKEVDTSTNVISKLHGFLVSPNIIESADRKHRHRRGHREHLNEGRGAVCSCEDDEQLEKQLEP